MSNGIWSIDPYKLAAQHRSLDGKVLVADLLRANKLLASDHGELAYNISFATDADNVCVMTGMAQASLTLCCQRCLQQFTQTVDCDFTVSPVNNDSEAKALPSCYEPILMQDGKVDVIELLEDELILALPQVPMHAPDVCKVKVADAQIDQAQEMNHPFQILQMLKVKKRED